MPGRRPGGQSIEDPDLPRAVDDRYLAVDGDEAPYYIVAIELLGDVVRDTFGNPEALDCSFE